MAKKFATGSGPEGERLIRFHPLGLALFSAALVLAGGLVGSGLVSFQDRHRPGKASGAGLEAESRSDRTAPPETVPPWGELVHHETWIERPEEYVAEEARTNQLPAWIFGNMPVSGVRNLMVSCGLTAAQIERALSAQCVSVAAEATTVKPDDELVLSLSPEVRAALYRVLARNPANRYIWIPFIFQGQTPEEWFMGDNLEAETIAQARKLLYRRGTVFCFSDLEVMMHRVPSERQRLALVKALSRQPAELVRLRVRPDTDVDKILGYWSRGVQAKDARPLLESLRRLTNGGSVSLIYLLPPFARDRLFTFPKPAKPGEPARDCHWSTFNFFNETPDDRFSDPAYTIPYVETNYYPVAKATLYGDVLLVLKEETNVIHSAVYLADDIVFTKNGNNIHQPWTLMRIKDLLSVYEFAAPLKIAAYRRNNW